MNNTKIQMRNAIIIITIFAFITSAYAQPSYSTLIRFQLFNKEGKIVNRKIFTRDYKIANVFGDYVNLCDSCMDSRNEIYFDSLTNYVYLNLTTIGPQYSFAIYNLKDTMTVFLPFRTDDRQYLSIDSLTIHNGDYLFDFPCNVVVKNSQYKFFYGLTFCVVTKINFKRQGYLFKKSRYYGAERTYRKE